MSSTSTESQRYSLTLLNRLSQLGIATAIYAPDNVCLDQSDARSGHTTKPCPRWRQCHKHAYDLRRLHDQATGPVPGACPDGCPVIAIPLAEPHENGTVLLACLASLRYQKTEALERLCSQLGVDTAMFMSQGLSDAMSSHQVAAVLTSVLQFAAAEKRRAHAREQELEAVSQGLSQSYEELALLHRISDRMRLTQPPEDFFRELCNDLQVVLGVEHLWALWSPSTGPDAVINQQGPENQSLLDAAQRNLLWQRVRTGTQQPGGFLVCNHQTIRQDRSWPDWLHSLVAVPIQRGANMLGLLAAANRTDNGDFDSIDAKLLLSVANETAVYLENFRLYQDLQELLIGALRALTSSIDAKDPYTCGHSERVALIARWLAGRIGLSPNEVNDIYLAGLLHDVGKIGVSEAVLCKPGALLNSEFEQMMRHPLIGATILGGIRQMQAVTPAVLAHHEHFDGSGYPRGLAGDAIPLGGRIVMLADSFDAMTSDRTYRRALPHAMAIAEIRRFSGTQFDPILAEAFLDSDLTSLQHQLTTCSGPAVAFVPNQINILN